MSYTLTWRDPIKGTVQVPAGSIVTDAADIAFTGKGASNYGKAQQENLMRLLENFAGATPPERPTVGELWYDTVNKVLKLCFEKTVAGAKWRSLGGIQVTQVSETAPEEPGLGDIWFKRTGPLSGILYVYTGVGRYPSTAADIGGWNQLWPSPTLIAGREEYDAMLDLVVDLLGPTEAGGNGAIGKLLDVNVLTALDTALRARYEAAADANLLAAVGAEDATALRVDPDSQDWDLLLAAARYAVSRLELPPGYEEDISPVPFVSDGLPVNPALLNLQPTDVRYPGIERRANRNYGIIALSRLFTETMNVLSAAQANQYSLKGINGATGTNPSLASSVILQPHATFTGPLAATTTFSLTFRFASKAARDSFLNSGGAVQLGASVTGTAAGTQVASSLLENRGTLRFTRDKTRVFAATLPLTLVEAPVQKGLADGLVTAGTELISRTAEGGGATYTVRVSAQTVTTVTLRFELTTTGAVDGTINLSFSVIKDTDTYGTPATEVYGSPLAYQAGDETGTLTKV